MSHYTVLCNLGTDIDPTESEAVQNALEDLLAPYDENERVEPYKKRVDRQEKAQRARSATETYTASDGKVYKPTLEKRWTTEPLTPRDFRDQWDAIHPDKERIPDETWKEVTDSYYEAIAKMGDLYTDEEVAKAINDYWGHDEDDDDSETEHADENGIYHWTTYNPKSKWDWWSIGGRWQGYFTSKGAGLLGEPGVFGGGRVGPWQVDVVRVEDIDWDAMKKASIEESVRYYDEAREGDLLSWEDGTKKSDVTREEWAERAEKQWAPATHSICDPEKGWLEREKMGWFGVGYDGTMTHEQWVVAWKQYIDALDPKTVVAIVDCHI